MTPSSLSFTKRAEYTSSPLAKRLFQLMDNKKTNLALSADVTSAKKLLQLANALGPEIIMLKTHVDIIDDFTPELIIELKTLADKHHFLLFEDRKFADIGSTVQKQYAGGLYKIASWADIINAHSLPGSGIVKALALEGEILDRGLILIAEMSSAGHLMDKNYMQATLEMAKQFPHFVFGFITQHALSSEPQWINLTPGINIQNGTDALGQQYVTPEHAIGENGSDIIIVGRDILTAKDPLAQARLYRERAFLAYEKRLA